MTTLNDRIRKVNRAVTRHLAERFTITPMTRSEFGAAADQGRPGGAFRGHLKFYGDATDLGGTGATGATWSTQVGVTGAMLQVAEAEIPNGVTLLEGDVITATDRGDRKFKVSRVDRRLGLFCIELGDMG